MSSDFINVTDYNRIKDNLLYLYDVSKQFYEDYSLTDVPPNVSYDTYAYAEIWNSLENTLQDIVDNTYRLPTIGNRKIFTAYDPYIDYTELNRLERACLLYYQMFKGLEETVPYIPFTLGDYRGIKE